MFRYRFERSITPEAAYESLCGKKGFAFLDSSSEDRHLGRHSIMAVDPFLTFISKGESITVIEGGEQTLLSGDPLQALDEVLERFAGIEQVDLPFSGGAIGSFSYDLGRQIERLPQSAQDDRDFPDIYLNFYHGALVFDHQTGETFYADRDLDSGASRRLEILRDWLEASDLESMTPFKLTGPLQANMTYEEYLDKVRRIKAYIEAGDIYQANMTLRYSAPCQGDSAQLFHRLRKRNPAPFSAYLDFGQWQILSSSPERFIEVRGRKISTRPIKGTAPRGASPEEDRRNRESLDQSEKDHAELLMIVDLERNDLGHVAEIGSVRVPELFVIEAYETVYHLVSTVEAILKEEISFGDLMRAVFPGGSITGAPKIRAMEIIDELEPTQRNVYTGAIGYIDFSGDMDLNIAIRTIVNHGDVVDYQVGGGIVWDSDEEDEFVETEHKGRALREVLTSE